MPNPTKEFFTQLLTKALDSIPELIAKNEQLQSALQERDATIEALRAQVESKWIPVHKETPRIGQYVQLFSNGVVQEVNPMFDDAEDGYFWHMHDLLDEDPYIKSSDCWMPLPNPP